VSFFWEQGKIVCLNESGALLNPSQALFRPLQALLRGLVGS
jgi:hypothetical protein